MRVRSAWALGVCLPDTEAERTLARLLGDSEPAIRLIAAESILSLAESEHAAAAEDEMLRFFRESSRAKTRIKAAGFLLRRRRHRDHCIDLLLKALEDVRTRRAAILAFLTGDLLCDRIESALMDVALSTSRYTSYPSDLAALDAAWVLSLLGPRRRSSHPCSLAAFMTATCFRVEQAVRACVVSDVLPWRASRSYFEVCTIRTLKCAFIREWVCANSASVSRRVTLWISWRTPAPRCGAGRFAGFCVGTSRTPRFRRSWLAWRSTTKALEFGRGQLPP